MMDLKKKVVENFSDVGFWRKGLSMRQGILPVYYWLTGGDGVRIMDEEWDVLIILDACRYDLFESVAASSLPGTSQSRRSQGSSTPEFLRGNFEGEEYHDAVYVTANPQVNVRIDSEEIFHEVISVWETDWDSGIGTVRPGPMADRVIDAIEEYPDKRIIAHFLQPHYPFIGETAADIDHSGITGEKIGVILEQETPNSRKDIWTRLENGELDDTTVWKAYSETLEVSLPELKRVLNSTSRRTVLTSDHGR